MDNAVCIFGLGYVGLPLACLCARRGLRVWGVDLNLGIVEKVNKGKSHINDAGLKKEVAKLRGKIRATTNAAEAMRTADVVIVCVPTPVDENQEPDLSPLEGACAEISKNLRKGQMVVIESTVYPGTTEEVALPVLEKSGLKAGNDFDLAHCPERIDPGNKKWQVGKIPRVVAAISPAGTRRAAKFYRRIIDADVLEMNSVKAAEAVKVTENSFRDVNIAFVNELAKSFGQMGIDIIEVIKGASTKPFGFMPFYPGPGVGGHCFGRNELVFAKIDNEFGVFSFDDFFKSMKKLFGSTAVEKVEFVFPRKVEVLSFDLNLKKSCFRKVQAVSKRFYEKSVKLTLAGNYSLTVTDRHPVIVSDNEIGFAVKFADELGVSDKLVLSTGLPHEIAVDCIDLIEHLPPALAKKTRVKPVNGAFCSLKDSIHKALLGSAESPRDIYRDNSMPLKTFLELEKRGLVPFSRKQIWLCTGRGPSFSKIRAVVPVNADFCRLVGYYLSEGCITKEKTLRTRFSFNVSEKELIGDLKSIVEELGLKHSVHKSKDFDSLTIRVSSDIFSFLLGGVLKCGTNCYNMCVPSQIFLSSRQNRDALLAGLMRGDGGVSVYSGKRHYSKRGREFFHENNSVEISFFSSSPRLFQQAVMLLLDAGFTPLLSRRKNYLSLFGAQNASKAVALFDGEKKGKINSYLGSQMKVIPARAMEVFRGFALLPLRRVENVSTDEVFSVEVEGTNTIVSSNSIVAHNCIPVDPYYLIKKARDLGFEHRFLSLAREINNSMPAYVASLVKKMAADLGSQPSGLRVCVLGIAYKAGIDDARNSPSLAIIELLKKDGMVVVSFDPRIPGKSTAKSLGEAPEGAEILVLATPHKEFLGSISPSMLKKAGIRGVIDARNCLDKAAITGAGILYAGVGR